MKKFNKIIVFILMLALSVASVLACPVLVFAATPVLIGATITLAKMPTKGEVNTTIYIPVGESASGTVVTKIKKPGDKEFTTNGLGTPAAKPGDNSGKLYYHFQPKMIGDYQVKYEVEGNITKSEIYTIKVSGTKATLSFEKNTPFMLPETVGAESELVLPFPVISQTGLEEDEVVGNHPDDTGDNDVTITATDPNKGALTLATKEINGKKYYVFKPAKNADETPVLGTYAIEYSYKNTSNVWVRNSFKITVSGNYGLTQPSYKTTWEGSMPTSAVLGEELKLPKPIIVDSKNNNANVKSYTTVEVKYINGAETVDYTDKVDTEEYTFTPKHEAKNNARYDITYKTYTLDAIDWANVESGKTLAEVLAAVEESKVIVNKFTLENVKDTVKPQPKPVAAYTVNENVDVTMKDAEDVSYLIPTKVASGKPVKLPAIYATDNDPYNKLTLNRYVIDESKTSINIDTTSDAPTEQEKGNIKFTPAKVNEEVTVSFEKEGTYTIRYQAKDSSGNNNTQVTYKIVVKDGYQDGVEPFITMPSIQSSVKVGETIKFNKPTVVDYVKNHKEDPTETDTSDANIKTTVFFYEGEYNASIVPTAQNTLKLENSMYELKVADNSTATKITVVVMAEDDSNNKGIEYKTINVYNTNDSVAPTLLTPDFSALEATIGQNEEVLIPEVKFHDLGDAGVDNTSYLTASVRVLDSKNNEIEVTGLQFIYDGTNIVMKNGKFVTTSAGTYLITITTTDIGGNSLVNSVSFEVADTNAPAIELEAIKTTLEVNESYYLPLPKVVDDGTIIENKATTVVEFVGNNPKYYFNNETLEFIPFKVGTYSFKYLAKDATGNPAESQVFTIIVSDTKAPVIEIDETNGGVPVIADKDVEVTLPVFTATDENGIKDLVITVTNPDGDPVEHVDGKDYTFIFKQDGKYKVVYKAVDNSDKTTTKEFTIAVGDVVAPVVELADGNKHINTNFVIGNSLEVLLNGITIKDGTTVLDTEAKILEAIRDKDLVITLTTPDGSTITFDEARDNYSYQFDKAGTYTLTYKAYDEAKNVDPISYTFEVKAQENESFVSEQTWGIVLFIISVALLGGVVIYFIKTKDTSDKKAKAKAKEKAKELAKKDEEKAEDAE